MKNAIRKTKKITLVLLLIIPILTLSGCTEEQGQTNNQITNDLIGTWTYFEGGTITFKEDQTINIIDIARFQAMNLDGIYNFTVNNHDLTFSDDSTAITFEITEIEGKILTIKDSTGGNLTFNKK